VNIQNGNVESFRVINDAINDVLPNGENFLSAGNALRSACHVLNKRGKPRKKQQFGLSAMRE